MTNNQELIALPLTEGRVSAHFGHCERMALLLVDLQAKKILGAQVLTPPPHEPGRLPRWIGEQRAGLVIAGGMGHRAKDLLEQHGVQVVLGAPPAEAGEVVEQYLTGTLQTGPNACDH